VGDTQDLAALANEIHTFIVTKLVDATDSGPPAGGDSACIEEQQGRAPGRPPTAAAGGVNGHGTIQGEAVSKSCMAGFRVAILAILVSVLPAVSTDPVKWGPPDNGLRMAVNLANLQIHVTLQDVSKKDLLVPVGITVIRPHPTSLRVQLKLPGGATPQVIYTGIGFVAGYAEPFTVALHAGESHTISTPVSLYYVGNVGSARLPTFIKRRCQLWVELEVKESECPKPPIPTPLDALRRTFPCWHGKVASNVLELPK
jgi:hypothetical protein